MTTTVAQPTKGTIAPADYSELFAEYYDTVCGLVRKAGIHTDSVEDVASNILLRFYERDFLAQFDPTKTFTHDGEEHTAKFSTFLGAFVKTYLRHYYQRQGIESSREPVICDKPVGDGSATLIEVMGHMTEDIHDIDYTDFVSFVNIRLEALPKKPRSPQDLAALFRAVMVQVARDGKYVTADLADEFGVSPTAINSWLRDLREQVKYITCEYTNDAHLYVGEFCTSCQHQR